MEWNGVEWNGMKCSGTEYDGIGEVDYGAMVWIGLEGLGYSDMELNRMNGIGVKLM